MAKRTTDFAQQNTERAMEMTVYGMDWIRELTERNLDQTKAAVESLLTIMSSAFDRACGCLPHEFRNSAPTRRKLALHIIHRVDDGESDPTRLADSAILSLVR